MKRSKFGHSLNKATTDGDGCQSADVDVDASQNGYAVLHQYGLLTILSGAPMLIAVKPLNELEAIASFSSDFYTRIK